WPTTGCATAVQSSHSGAVGVKCPYSRSRHPATVARALREAHIQRVAARGFAVLLLVLIGLVGLSVNSLAKENPGHHYGRCCNPGHHYGQLKHQLPPAPHPGPAPAP